MTLKRPFIYVGSYVSDEDAARHPAFSQAANLYQAKFIDFAQPSDVITLVPFFVTDARTFSSPRPIKFVCHSAPWLPRFLQRFWRWFADTVVACVYVSRTRGRDVFFYNLDKQNLFLAALVRFLLCRRVYVIVADYMRYDSRMLQAVFDWFTRRTQGTLVLNSNIRCHPNRRVMPGLLYEDSIVVAPAAVLNRRVLMSGSLGRTTGLELALECFSKNPEYELVLTGRPFRYSEAEFSAFISSYTSRYPNIRYLGLLEPEAYLETLRHCDVALSLRDPRDTEHMHNFPSKILEYLARSRIVISTMTYQDVPEGVLVISAFDAHALAQVLMELHQQKMGAIARHRERIQDYLRERFSAPQLVALLDELMEVAR